MQENPWQLTRLLTFDESTSVLLSSEFSDREVLDLKARRRTKTSRTGNIACFLL
jgi:hypothetical protein